MAAPESSRRATHVGPDEPLTLDSWTLEVGGLVAQPSQLTLGDFADLEARTSLTSKTRCPDGPIGTDGSIFEGVPLAWLVEQAGVQEDARYVCVHSGPFTAAFTLDSLDRRQSLLAVRKDGHRLSWTDGGPVRLVVEQGACFDTVKWVERVTLERDGALHCPGAARGGGGTRGDAGRLTPAVRGGASQTFRALRGDGASGGRGSGRIHYQW